MYLYDFVVNNLFEEHFNPYNESQGDTKQHLNDSFLQLHQLGWELCVINIST